MTSLLIALMLATTPVAQTTPDCNVKVEKIFHEPFECKPGLVKVKCGSRIICQKPTEPVCEKPEPLPQKVIIVEKKPDTGPEVIVFPTKYPVEEPSRWHHGPYLELGTSFVRPNNVLSAKDGDQWTMLEGNLGYHAHYMPWRLGGRLFISNYGPSLEFQFYPIQGEGLEWHLFAGPRWVGGPFSHYPSVIDVYRRWDISWGTGVEYPLDDAKHWVLLGDLRVSTALYHQSEQNWTYEPAHVFTNELKQVRLLGGLMYRF
jgi:hypothetical protein